MKSGTTTLERAFEMAASGHFDTVSQIRRQLDKEGYDSKQVAGRTLMSQLNRFIKAALS